MPNFYGIHFFFADTIDVTCIGSDYASHKSFFMVTLWLLSVKRL